VRTIVAGRHANQVESFRAVEDPQHIKVGEAFDVGQSGLELGEDFEIAFGVVLGTEALRDIVGLRVRAANVTDGARGEH
jgi:hypothetical protein